MNTKWVIEYVLEWGLWYKQERVGSFWIGENDTIQIILSLQDKDWIQFVKTKLNRIFFRERHEREYKMKEKYGILFYSFWG